MVSVFCTRKKPNEPPYQNRYEVSLPKFLHIFFDHIGHIPYLPYNIMLLGTSRIVLKTPAFSIVNDEFEIDASMEETECIAAAYQFFMKAICYAARKDENATKLHIRLFGTRFWNFFPQTIYSEYISGALLPPDALRRVIAYVEDIYDERDISAICDLNIQMEEVVSAIEEWNNACRAVPLRELLR